MAVYERPHAVQAVDKQRGAEANHGDFDHGPVSRLESYYDPSFVTSLRHHLISVEPPMWVIDSSLVRDGQGQALPDDEASEWIPPFMEFVEEQVTKDGEWEPFNVKNALHNPPERFWIDGSNGGFVAEKLAGLQAFLKSASGSDSTFLDKGRRFALKRYPHSGVPANAEALGGNLSHLYPAENLHIDRLQKDADHDALAKVGSEPKDEANLHGDPTHFTLVLNFDDASGGTFFPNGRLLTDLASAPDGVASGPNGGIIVESRRGRALLWSNHRGATAPSGRVLPLYSSLHQSLLQASQTSAPGARRVCIFGWAESGRKWERCGFHECLDHEPPQMRAKFFGRTLLEELQGWELGPRAAELPHHLRSRDVQAEIQAEFAKGPSEETRNWLAMFGYTDKQMILQLMVTSLADGHYDWAFISMGGEKKCSFKSKSRSLLLPEFRKQAMDAYKGSVLTGKQINNMDVFEHITQKPIQDVNRQIQQGENIIVALQVIDTPEDKRNQLEVEANSRRMSLARAGTSNLAAPSSSSSDDQQQPMLARGASEQWQSVRRQDQQIEDKTVIETPYTTAAEEQTEAI